MTDELFFDTDCLSAFLWINDTNILHKLYGGRIVLPEPVYQELSNPSIPHIKQRTDIMISNKDISVKTIEIDTEEYNKKYNLKHIDTGQILAEALKREMMVMLHGGGVCYRGALPVAEEMAKFYHVVLVAYDGFNPDGPERGIP